MNPLLYEINTRCWLRELSERSGKTVTLPNVPQSEFVVWQRLGFTHIWLMGVWQTGPRSCAQSLAQLETRHACRELLPDFTDADIAGSPYAIADYQASPALGGEAALEIFREQLHAHGLKLILDFVANHVGLDHRWVTERPELFVQSPGETAGFFRQPTRRGTYWLAHGRDPYYPPWADTVQLDYRIPATHRAMIDQLTSVTRQCDGVRCDMAMLLLNEVFARTWADFPRSNAVPVHEFWADVISYIKRVSPEFLFMAEGYWDLEARLQSLGFDYTYNKRLYDHLVHREHAEVQRNLLQAGPGFVNSSVHFLENHDEPRIASLLTLPEHRAAALATFGLPGMRLLHEGQLTGATKRVSVHLGRRPVEPIQPDIAAFYERLLQVLKTTSVGKGRGVMLNPSPAWTGNPTAQYFVIVQWQSAPPEFDLVVVNLAPHPSQCYAPLRIAGLADRNWQLTNLLGDEQYQRSGDDLARAGLYLDVPAQGAQLFHFQPIL
ncbi:MAG: alpha-amylase [Verrucomicrobia bacterium]|nr:alpha-amylase [Verrucomicrobiota bacterium]